ncbi:COG1361 S-layer family protein [Vallitalea okinawensis]|uniref:COG1361 S-layer family protein n=1 Tax=Vallitalea okinawensis TaxID=2078660 RepID=UPI000CFCD848|nr:COG1361 S-layer family protein [Vallitalea okinawensis]
MRSNRGVRVYQGILALIIIIIIAMPVLATETYSPRIEIVNKDMPEVEAGQTITIPIDIKNISTYFLKNIEVTPTLEEDSPFIGDSLLLNQTIESIKMRDNHLLEFVLQVDKNAKEGIYPIVFNIKYKASQTVYDETALVYVKVTTDQLPAEIIVDSLTYDVSTPISGEEFDINLSLKNTGTLKAENVLVVLSSNNNFIVTDNQSEQYILSIPGMVKSNVQYSITPKEELESGLYPINGTVTYIDNYKESKTKEFELFIPVEGEGFTGKVNLAVENMSQLGQVNVNEEFTVDFDVVNMGEGKASDLQIVAEPESDKIIPVSLNKKILDTLEAGEKTTLSYSFRAIDGVETKNYPIKLTFTYTENKEEMSFSQYVGINVQGKSASSTSTVPLVIVSDYSSDPTIVNAGEEFNLDLTLWNTNSEKAVQNMKVTLQIKENSEDTQDDVFTPVDGSNTLYVPYLEPGAKTSQQLRFYTVPDAKARNYKIEVNFEYEYEQADEITKGTSTDQIGIQVVQPAEIQVVNFNTDSAPQFAGDKGYVYITCNNIGNVKVKNLQAIIKGDLGEETIFVGDLDSGQSHEFKFKLRPDQVGTMNETITVSYKDTRGEVHESTEEFTLDIMEPMPEPDFDMYEDMGNMEGMEEEQGSKTPWIVGGVALGALIIVILLIIRRRRKKKELMFDEAI